MSPKGRPEGESLSAQREGIPVSPPESRPAPLPIARALTDAELSASCTAALAHWNARDPLWVFGYGSLIWRPDLHFEARVPARVFGYHRRLCLRSVRYRGTAACPGLVAGLDRGGSCAGIAFRLPVVGLRQQFEQLWRREMFLGSYQPRWLTAQLLQDRRAAPVGSAAPQRVRALAFVVRLDAPHYCGSLAEPDVLAVLANARGVLGSSLDYLERTVAALHAEGLRDLHLERLMRMAARAAGRPPAPLEDRPPAGAPLPPIEPSVGELS
jgi:cation transport protein ChaC